MLSLHACVPNRIYNATREESIQTLQEPGGGQVGVELAIIEFDEFGMLWDRRQLEDATELIRARNRRSERGIAVVTYVHGWMHSGDAERRGSDLERFSEWSRGLAATFDEEGDSAPDHLVVVYLAWRGASSRFPLLSAATFWDRQRAAERVASYQMLESLIRIKSAGKERSDSKVLVSGHSMGGMVLARTLAPSLNALLLHRGEEGVSDLTDLLVMHNPALDALTAYQFIDFLKRERVQAELRHPDGSTEPARGPVLLAITSEADWVTGGAYPFGRTIGHLTSSFRAGRPEDGPSQRMLATRAVGHVDGLISHRAWVEDGEVRLERVEGAYNDTPFWVVQVSSEISSDHGDIFNPRYTELYRRILRENRLFDTDARVWVRSGARRP